MSSNDFLVFRDRAGLELGFTEMVRSAGESVEDAARRIGGNRQVIGPDGEPIRRDFGGYLSPVTARWRLPGTGLKAIDEVLRGFEFPAWGTVYALSSRDLEQDRTARQFWRAVAQVAVEYAVHGGASRHHDGDAWKTVTGPMPEQARQHIDEARAMLPDFARTWAGFVAALPGNEGLRPQPARAREVA